MTNTNLSGIEFFATLKTVSKTLRQARLRIDGRVDAIAWSNRRPRSIAR